MLPKANRLKKSSNFDRVYKKGIHLKGSFGKLIYLKLRENDSISQHAKLQKSQMRKMSSKSLGLQTAKSLPPTRIGIVVPSKLGEAFERNRAKRQIRAVFRKYLDQIPRGLMISFILWNINFDYNQIKKDLKHLLTKVKSDII
jgi:ribonuclease P protein component